MNNQLSSTVTIRPLPLEERLAHLDQRIAERLGFLLKKAVPSRERTHQLIFLLQREAESSYQEFNSRIIAYYKVPFERRSRFEFFRIFEVVPSPWLHSQFILNFSTAKIGDSALFQAAKYFSFQLSTALTAPRDLIDPSFLFSVMVRLINPKAHQPKSGLRLMEFVTAWEATARGQWGARHEEFFRDLRKSMKAPSAIEPLPSYTTDEIWITQTDVDWLHEIMNAIEQGESLPEYPLSRGPELGALLQIEKLVNGHNAARDKCVEAEKLAAIHSALERECLRLLNLWGYGESLKDIGSVG